MASTRLRKVGNSLGATFPKELLEELNIKEGDELYLVKTEKGFELTPYDPNFAAEMEAYRHAIRENRNALRELAQ